jgi:Holliday junction resolvase-like predicted endonuclease
LQSHEIRFGDAFEAAIEQYLGLKGCRILPKRFNNSDGNTLNVDQLFQVNGKIYFIEQKVRDDHDSTKKRGQIQNFEKKLAILLEQYEEDSLVGMVYFIDPELKKNNNFYYAELGKMNTDYNVELHLFYGEQLFNYLEYQDVWAEILVYLREWKARIPDLPEINFDLDAEHTFNEIKDLNPQVYRKLIGNNEILTEIISTLFPEQTTLRLLHRYFETRPGTIYRTLATKLGDYLYINNTLI